jgi:hypothetical protein
VPYVFGIWVGGVRASFGKKFYRMVLSEELV